MPDQSYDLMVCALACSSPAPLAVSNVTFSLPGPPHGTVVTATEISVPRLRCRLVSTAAQPDRGIVNVDCPPEVLKLLERFEREIDSYRSGKYNETQVRREFIDPMFKALGWDIDNEQGYAEAYKDVIHEDTIKMGTATKAPDYCFRIGGTRKFFLEAKKPSVNVKDDVSPAFQLRRYAWSAKLPLSVLTDFEELAVYDCRAKPAKTDKASAGRILYLTYGDYESRWDEIAGIFSRDAILKGSFDKFAESSKRKRGTAEVDAAFLAEIEGWRDSLARTFALRNPDLSQRELNSAVQQTIDRIIFLRICEDRGVEPYGQLRDTLAGSAVYSRLLGLFIQADQRYNSGLFHFNPEKGRPGLPDELTPRLVVDDKPLKEIGKRLYYPDSPYEFSVLPADILGQVYEQFLGKVIRLTAGHRAVVEDKPEVKKAGGVYYTPTHVVDYIVEHTVGKLLEDKSPKEAAALRILDPACGSGSFLIGAYQHLLDWHRDWYVAHDPKKHRRQLYEHGAGDFRLTTAERKRILLNNVYGVDIDLQAVEVTKLSLLLKVLEGESAETIQMQLSLLHERALPDLDESIKCGNSLIGSELFESQPLHLFSDDERYRINVFDWSERFPRVFAGGEPGFDAVIGNPPYIRIQALREWAPIEADFYRDAYSAAARGNWDIYVVFVERGLDLLRSRGRLGFILPSKFLSTDYGAGLRGLIDERGVLDQLVDFGHEQVFTQATTYTCLLFLELSPHATTEYLRVNPKELVESEEESRLVPLSSLSGKPWRFAGAEAETLLAQIAAAGTPLLELPAAMSRGTSTGNDQVFCLQVADGGLATRAGVPVDIEPGILRRPIYATDYTRFRFRPRNGEVLIFPYDIGDGGYRLLGEEELRERFPKAHRYLSDHRRVLEERKQFQAWYGFSAPRNLHIHDTADLLVPLLADRGLAAPLPHLDEKFCLMASGGFSVSLGLGSGVHPYYVLGLVNSRLLFWNLRQISNKFRGGWITCTKQYFGTLPVFVVDPGSTGAESTRDQVILLVEHAVGLKAKLDGAGTSHGKGLLEQELAATERRLDGVVYALYGLSDSQIELVENDEL